MNNDFINQPGLVLDDIDLEEVNGHSFLNSSKSFVDYFDDLAESEGADSARL